MGCVLSSGGGQEPRWLASRGSTHPILVTFRFFSVNEMDQNAMKSPRDRWSCVLPRWQLNVNGNACNEKSQMKSAVHRFTIGLVTHQHNLSALEAFLQRELLALGG